MALMAKMASLMWVAVIVVLIVKMAFICMGGGDIGVNGKDGIIDVGVTVA